MMQRRWLAPIAASIFLLGSLAAHPVQAQGVADAMCQSHSGYLENALMLQQLGRTLDAAQQL